MKSPKTKLSPVPADIPAALDELGIAYRITGDEAVAVCPNPDHVSRNPHWSVNLTTGKHHCFSCGFGGSFMRLVALMRGTRFDEAELWVRTHRVVHQRTEAEEEEIGRVEEKPKTEVRESDMWAFTEPPEEELAKRQVSREAARQLEILWDGKGWIFPLRDPDNGRLLGWQVKRDKFVRNRPQDVQKHRSLHGLALARSVKEPGPVIVVESPLNGGRFVTCGFPVVVATYGIEFSEEQMRIVFSLGRDVLFAQDNDSAGQEKIARWLHDHPLERQYCSVFDYGRVYEDEYSHAYIHPKGDGRDPGNLSEKEIRRGVKWATPGRRTRFEEFPQWP